MVKDDTRTRAPFFRGLFVILAVTRVHMVGRVGRLVSHLAFSGAGSV